MSVLMEFAMFPTDKGAGGVSQYVAQVIEVIRESGVSYRLTPMGTVIEVDEMSQALDVLNRAYEVLSPQSDRIYCTVSFDIRKNRKNAIEGKISSIENKIGPISSI